jgi:hypothetical protein
MFDRKIETYKETNKQIKKIPFVLLVVLLANLFQVSNLLFFLAELESVHSRISSAQKKLMEVD